MQAQTNPLTRTQRVGTTLYLMCAALFAAGVVAQVFFIGALFLSGMGLLDVHRTVGRLLGALPVLAPVGGFLAPEPKRFVLYAFLLWFVYSLQFTFIWTVTQMGLPSLRSLHAVNALALFWLSLRLCAISYRTLRPASQRRVCVEEQVPAAESAR